MRNGALASQQALTAGVTTPIGSVATGQAPLPGAAAQGRGGRGGRGGSGPMVLGAGSTAGQSRGGVTGTRGVTVAGEVKNYVPVTPEMLKNPPPGDWLIFGRNYQRHSYSPLNQITRDNVRELRLKWIWAMNDSGANQTTPIVSTTAASVVHIHHGSKRLLIRPKGKFHLSPPPATPFGTAGGGIVPFN